MRFPSLSNAYKRLKVTFSLSRSNPTIRIGHYCRMSSVADILRTLEQIAPQNIALPGDKIGLQVGNPRIHVRKAFVTLDRSRAVAQAAIDAQADLIVSHHPLIWNPLQSITTKSYDSEVILLLTSRGIAHIAVHTNWDCAIHGVNCELAKRLGLENVMNFGTSSEIPALKMQFYLPKIGGEPLVEAILSEFEKESIGKIGEYERCAFLFEGIGTFKPTESAKPTIGQISKIQNVPEVKIELTIQTDQKDLAEQIVNRLHPYETPLVEFLDRRPISGIPIGRCGRLPNPMQFSDFLSNVNSVLNTRCTAWNGHNRVISKVAVVGGAAADEWSAAKALGADLFLTGEIPQHIALEASESGISMVAAGHYATEQPGVEVLKEKLAEQHPDVSWTLFTPEHGQSGRPVFE